MRKIILFSVILVLTLSFFMALNHEASLSLDYSQCYKKEVCPIKTELTININSTHAIRDCNDVNIYLIIDKVNCGSPHDFSFFKKDSGGRQTCSTTLNDLFWNVKKVLQEE